jgi:hypothetical protein
VNTLQFIRSAAACVAASLALATLAAPPAPVPKQRTFASAEEAAKALAEAVRAGEAAKVLEVVGPQSKSWIFTGDEVADRADWKKFLEAYDKKHSIAMQGDKAVLQVGDDDWPFPAPIVKKANTWAFDADSGREEVINRRVGRNELDTIQVLLAVVDAQREYAQQFDGVYAKVFRSSPGKKDGLYWASAPGEKESPLGPLAASASREGYKGDKGTAENPAPYHGYRYRILTAQGKNAKGGAYDYVVNGRMMGGFAVVAWPATYGVSGVKTFVVNHDGVVFEKDLGPGTEAAAQKVTRFDPDKTWEKVK